MCAATNLEHVLHVVWRDEGIVDGDDVDKGIGLSGTHDETSDTAEAIDADVHGSDS